MFIVVPQRIENTKMSARSFRREDAHENGAVRVADGRVDGLLVTFSL